jgi:hypothetical protein
MTLLDFTLNLLNGKSKKEADAPKNAKDAKKNLLLRGRVVKGIITDKIALGIKTF